jgi:hypothetical protein
MKYKLSGLSSLGLLIAITVPAVMLSSNAGVAANLNSSSEENALTHHSMVNFAPNLDEKLNLLVPSENNGKAIAGRTARWRQWPQILLPSSNIQQVDEGAIALASLPSAVETFRSLQNLG